MKKIVMLKGLPGSGKSFYAKQLASNGDFVRVNKDDLRAMLHNSQFSKSNEKFILKIRDLIINHAILNGKSVVVDDTNFAPKHQKTLEDLASLLGVEFEIRFFDTPIEDCIKRDLARPNSVGETVIRQMYSQYLAPPPIQQDITKTRAIICDIDGTLAHMVDRGPFEWAKVGNDTLDYDVSYILRKSKSDHYIILLSGRDSVCRTETEEWLKKHSVAYDELWMRPAGDNRPDIEIKRELFTKHIKDKYYVDFVIDDRISVCRLWHELGLKLFRVGNPDAVF